MDGEELLSGPVSGDPVPGDPSGGFRSLAAATGRTADEVAAIAAAGGLAELIAEINSGGVVPDDAVATGDDALAEDLVKGRFQERSEISEVSRVALSGYRSLAEASGRELLEVVEAAQAGQLSSVVLQAMERRDGYRGSLVEQRGRRVSPRQALMELRAKSPAALALRVHTARQRQLEIRRRRAVWVCAA